MNVPFVDLQANVRSLGSEVFDALRRVMERGAFILGEEVSRFESEFAAYCRAGHAVGVDSGTSALELSLRALEVGPGDEVITAANTFIATAFAISYTGATPVLVDVDPRTYTMDPKAVEQAVTPTTKAVVPVHLYGQPADMDPILDVAKRHGLAVVEDACQAHGAEYKDRWVGTLGAAAAFSFYPSKNLGAFGDGGMLVTDLPEVAERVRGLRDYGRVEKYRHAHLGYNRRLDALQAAVLRVKLKRLDEWNRSRRHAARLYDRALRGMDVVTPEVAPYARHVFHLYVIRARDREGLRAHLLDRGVQTGIHYPIPVHLQEACRFLGYRMGDFPVTEEQARQVLSLPMYPELTEGQVLRVAEAIGEFVSAG